MGRRQHTSNPQLAAVDRAHGPRLLALPCVLVWATAWRDDANRVIAPLLGLPGLAVADLPEAPEAGDAGVLHWKTRALVDAAAGLPFVWVDDEITDLDRAWVASHHPGRALLHRVDSGVGLTLADLAVLGAWLREPAARGDGRVEGVRDTPLPPAPRPFRGRPGTEF